MTEFFGLGPSSVAVFLARILLGLLFLYQGADKIFSVKIRTVIETINPAYRKARLPGWLITTVAYFTSYVEFFGGILLILGLFKFATLYLLGIEMLIVAAGFSMVDAVWKMDVYFPRFALLIFILLCDPSTDVLLLDRLIRH